MELYADQFLKGYPFQLQGQRTHLGRLLRTAPERGSRVVCLREHVGKRGSGALLGVRLRSSIVVTKRGLSQILWTSPSKTYLRRVPLTLDKLDRELNHVRLRLGIKLAARVWSTSQRKHTFHEEP
jgi:hypothetical protein